MEIEVVNIIILNRKAKVKSSYFPKDLVFPYSNKKDLINIINLIVDNYGIEITISVNDKDKGKTYTFNNEYIRKVIYPRYKKYKRIVYNPDRMIEVSVSNKDAKQDKLERLMRDIQRARKDGNTSRDKALCKQYLRLSGNWSD